MQQEPDLKISEVAHELSVSIRTVWELVSDGELATYKVGRARRIRRDSLDAFKEHAAVAARKAVAR